jgi:hypothetical protein
VVVVAGVLLSVAVTVRFVVPAAVGVPLMAHPEEVRPAGRVAGVMRQEYGAVPPLTPTVPA